MAASQKALGSVNSLTHRGYGEVKPAGELLALPPGFQYSVISYEGETMADGFPVPSAMDGMAAFKLSNGNVLLIRNHEIAEAGNRLRPRPAASNSTSDGITAHLLDTDYGPRRFAYDPFSGGGTTSIEWDPRTRRKVREHWSLVGTLRNCAGGPTPWGSWITCEETLEGSTANGYAREHGYCFEVPSTTSPGAPAEAIPLRRMGRFAHEAVAVDPATSIIYETEDQGDVSGFYRYVPATKPARAGDLANDNGRLEMLKVDAANGYVTCIDQQVGAVLPVSWVAVPNPDPTPQSAAVNGATASVCFQQGLNNGGAIFRRGEGCWYSQGKIYFTCTNGGEVGLGQIWMHDPVASTITMVFETPDPHVLDFPDNIAVSPRGGLAVCEDGSGGQRVLGVTPSGEIFEFARNIFNTSETAGVCYSPDGQTMFLNIYGRSTVRTSTRYGTVRQIPIGSEAQDKALTVAIWGPWGTGLL
ncbi:MAG: DUF839 domain-containing protein [Acidobacteria bacterium]|nr:DUF839 domain-containing protein [Acidobacteriota bacterium]